MHLFERTNEENNINPIRINGLLRMAILHMDIKESINAQIMRGRKKDIYTTPKRKTERKRNIKCTEEIQRKKERRFYSARHDFYAHVRMNERMNGFC